MAGSDILPAKKSTHTAKSGYNIIANGGCGSFTMRRGNGFTLIELLVVVAIIALLVAIVVPAVNKARQEAQRVVCKSNLKQFAYAWYYYCNDNGGQMPELTHAIGGGNWYVEFGKYLGDSSEEQDVWDCPTDEHKETNLIGYTLPFANVLAYWVNLQNVYPWPVARAPHNIGDVRRTSEVMSLTETSAPIEAVLTPYGPTPYSTFPLDEDFDGDGVLDSNEYERRLGEDWFGYPTPYNRVAARHPGRTCNIGFMDGHVESQFINDMLYDRVLWAVELVGMEP